jgi:pyruvate formate lyase activating enzyme
MATCLTCGQSSPHIAKELRACRDCILHKFGEVKQRVLETHRTRVEFGLEPEPPRDLDGIQCKLCVNACRIQVGSFGYCGVRENRAGRVRAWAGGGSVSWYFDNLPTNCVADWVCAGGIGAGYPKYAYTDGPEYGYKNLAVFYHACTFDCLFCQNWTYRLETRRGPVRSPEELANCIDERTSCICFFGGDPTPQLPHALRASRMAVEKTRHAVSGVRRRRSEGDRRHANSQRTKASGQLDPGGRRILRICWETNGSMHPAAAETMMRLSIETGGCVKFDIKAFDEGLHIALCGVTNRRTLENFGLLASLAGRRPEPPALVASTLLVPGYVEEEEVRAIASFIASLDPDIPYALLAFHPHFRMADLHTTSARRAEGAREAALSVGLRNVRIGNVHLLGSSY